MCTCSFAAIFYIKDSLISHFTYVLIIFKTSIRSDLLTTDGFQYRPTSAVAHL